MNQKDIQELLECFPFKKNLKSSEKEKKIKDEVLKETLAEKQRKARYEREEEEFQAILAARRLQKESK